MDKNPPITTVINKTATVGTESEFRTFGYEVLAGPDDLNVEAKENFCVYRFDYSQGLLEQQTRKGTHQDCRPLQARRGAL